MTSYSLSLHEIDTVRNSKGVITSAIEIMVRKCHIKILSDPLVKTLITTKWQRFAGAQFSFQMLSYLVFVVAQTFLVWLHCSSSQWNQTSRQVRQGCVGHVDAKRRLELLLDPQALEIVCMIFAGLFLLLELFDLSAWTVQVSVYEGMKCSPLYVIELHSLPCALHLRSTTAAT